LVSRLRLHDAIIAAAPVADTLKRADAQGNVDATVDRAGLWGAQTPQVFRAHVIRSVFATADDAELDSATDCAGMAERRGIGVAMLDPGAPNMKVTTQADLRLVEVLLGSGRIA
jgi:2-C-methyl-D-erythritol 4-phosphate cytidylyltransferase